MYLSAQGEHWDAWRLLLLRVIEPGNRHFGDFAEDPPLGSPEASLPIADSAEIVDVADLRTGLLLFPEPFTLGEAPECLGSGLVGGLPCDLLPRLLYEGRALGHDYKRYS